VTTIERAERAAGAAETAAAPRPGPVRLPTFLIIGAMRAGTTTLYRHLDLHPDVFLPQTKEPNTLCAPDAAEGAARAEYARLFAAARDARCLGEASTAYTKAPDFGDVAARARAVLGPELKLVYIVRHPIERIRSQHHLERANRLTERPLEAAVREQPRFLNYSRYAMQLEPWLAAFGAERLMVLRFENYVADTPFWYGEVCRFLGLAPGAVAALPEEAYNKTAHRPSVTPFWRHHVFGRDWYRLHLRQMLPRPLRELGARALLPKAPAQAETLAAPTRAWLWEQLADDTARFEGLMAATFPSPMDRLVYERGS
jgi:hypothetical protein